MSLNYLATRFTCSWPWSTMVMLCDGRMVCGCADPYGKRVLGDTRVESDLNVVGRCTLNGTEVRGNVTLFVGGSLVARDARIRGDLEGTRADFVDLQRTRVDGKVDLDGLVGDLTTFEESEIHGDVELNANRSALE